MLIASIGYNCSAASASRCVRIVLLLAGVLFSQTLAGQSRHERREARLAESAQPKGVAGGVTLSSSLPLASAYDTVLNSLKREGRVIDSADREIGQIITAMEITGRFSQTGTRLQITFIKEGESKTSIRVAVTQQKRKKLLQTEPWGDPKVNEAESQRAAEQLKKALEPSSAS